MNWEESAKNHGEGPGLQFDGTSPKALEMHTVLAKFHHLHQEQKLTCEVARHMAVQAAHTF